MDWILDEAVEDLENLSKGMKENIVQADKSRSNYAEDTTKLGHDMYGYWRGYKAALEIYENRIQDILKDIEEKKQEEVRYFEEAEEDLREKRYEASI